MADRAEGDDAWYESDETGRPHGEVARAEPAVARAEPAVDSGVLGPDRSMPIRFPAAAAAAAAAGDGRVFSPPAPLPPPWGAVTAASSSRTWTRARCVRQGEAIRIGSADEEEARPGETRR